MDLRTVSRLGLIWLCLGLNWLKLGLFWLKLGLNWVCFFVKSGFLGENRIKLGLFVKIECVWKYVIISQEGWGKVAEEQRHRVNRLEIPPTGKQVSTNRGYIPH